MSEKLIDMLPSRFKLSPEAVEFEETLEGVMSLTEEGRTELLLQLNLESATWGLALWEKQYGLETESEKDYASRRSRIKSKMRGSGTTTVEFIKNITESFVNGEADVIEHNDEYYFEVKMLSVKGIPPHFEDLKAAVEEIKPAHLAVVYVILYNTHRYLSQFTHGQLAAYTNLEVREKNIIDGVENIY